MLPICVMVVALNSPALAHPKHARQGEMEQWGARKASRIWPHAVQVPADVGLTEMFLLFCMRVFPSHLAPAAPCCCQGMSRTAGASGDKPAGKCISFWAWLSPATPQAGRRLG